jgi:hypothetical protein
MSLTPEAGDVWGSVDEPDDVMLVLSVLNGRMRYSATWSHLLVEDDSLSMPGMQLLVRNGKPFPPVSPASESTVPVECAVMGCCDGVIIIDGRSGQTAAQRAAGMTNLSFDGIVTVNVPKRSPAVLPDVTAAR